MSEETLTERGNRIRRTLLAAIASFDYAAIDPEAEPHRLAFRNYKAKLETGAEAYRVNEQDAERVPVDNAIGIVSTLTTIKAGGHGGQAAQMFGAIRERARLSAVWYAALKQDAVRLNVPVNLVSYVRFGISKEQAKWLLDREIAPDIVARAFHEAGILKDSLAYYEETGIGVSVTPDPEPVSRGVTPEQVFPDEPPAETPKGRMGVLHIEKTRNYKGNRQGRKK